MATVRLIMEIRTNQTPTSLYHSVEAMIANENRRDLTILGGSAHFLCDYDGCGVESVSSCDECDGRFCSDHGSKGGDREGGEGEPARAVPALCFQHGGFNADAI